MSRLPSAPWFLLAGPAIFTSSCFPCLLLHYVFPEVFLRFAGKLSLSNSKKASLTAIISRALPMPLFHLHIFVNNHYNWPTTSVVLLIRESFILYAYYNSLHMSCQRTSSKRRSISSSSPNSLQGMSSLPGFHPSMVTDNFLYFF